MPQDNSDDGRKRTEDVVRTYFEQTDRVLSSLKAAHFEGLKELDLVKAKLKEGKMPEIRL